MSNEFGSKEFHTETKSKSKLLKEKEKMLLQKESTLLLFESSLKKKEQILKEEVEVHKTSVEERALLTSTIAILTVQEDEKDQQINKLKAELDELKKKTSKKRAYFEDLNKDVPSNIKDIIDDYGFFNIVEMFRVILGGDVQQSYINKFTKTLVNFDNDNSIVKHKYTRMFSLIGTKSFYLPTYFETFLSPIYEKAVAYIEKYPTEVFYLSPYSVVVKEIAEIEPPSEAQEEEVEDINESGDTDTVKTHDKLSKQSYFDKKSSKTILAEQSDQEVSKFAADDLD
jgi:hypothetical protein